MSNQESNTYNQPTALITGASSGIGAAFAHQLAADNYHLILAARREEKLNALATEIQTKHAITVKVLPADLTQPNDVKRVVEQIKTCKDLALLINNAGFGISGNFWNVKIQNHLDMIQVHDIATVQLTYAALPGMLDRHTGAIINVSSIAAFVARSSGTMYHTTKAFLNAFSEGLHTELRGSGIKVQVLCPGFTITGFHDTPEYKNFRRSSLPKFAWLTAGQVARESLSDLQKGKLISIPGAFYRWFVFFVTNPLTGPLLRLVSGRLMKQTRSEQ